MSDIHPNVTDLTLRYRGAATGFDRVIKRPHNTISMRRQKGEGDASYAARLYEALQREQDKLNRNGFRSIKELSPQDQDFLNGYELSKKRQHIVSAGKYFDDALFDRDMSALFRSLKSLSNYFKMGGDSSLNSDAFALLANMSRSDCPVINPTKEDEVGFKAFLYSAMHMMVTQTPKGLGRVQAVHDTLHARQSKGFELESIFRAMGSQFHLSHDFFDTKYARNYVLPHPELPDILDWADPIETLGFVIDKNSLLLTQVLFRCTKKIESWYSETRLRDRSEDNDDFISRRFAKMAEPDEGLSFAGMVRKKMMDAIEHGHPQKKSLDSYLGNVEEVRLQQSRELDSRRAHTETKIKSLLDEQKEKELRFYRGWGTPPAP